MKIRVALVVGHTISGDKGAYSETLKSSEFDYWSDVGKRVVTLSKGSNVQFIIINMYEHRIQSYYERQKALADMLNKQDFDFVIELHFNAASPLANGTETLYWFGSKMGLKVAQQLSGNVVKDFGTTVRGVAGAKALVNKNDRGYYFAYLQKAVAVIFEPFFGSNVADATKFLDKDKVACHLLNSVASLRTLKLAA